MLGLHRNYLKLAIDPPLTYETDHGSTGMPFSCARTPQGDRSAVAAIALDFLASPLRHDRKLCTGEIRIGEVRNFPART